MHLEYLRYMSPKKESSLKKFSKILRMIKNRALLTNEKSQGILIAPHISIA